MQRWGNPDGVPFGRYPSGVAREAEATSGGVTIGSQLRAGWWWGTDRRAGGEFSRARITDARPAGQSPRAPEAGSAHRPDAS